MQRQPVKRGEDSCNGCGQICNPASRWMSSVSISERFLSKHEREAHYLSDMKCRFVEVPYSLEVLGCGQKKLPNAKAGIKCSNCSPQSQHPWRLCLHSNSVSMASLRGWPPRLSERLNAVSLRWVSTATCQMRTSSSAA